nr:glycosyltransferase family 4 protein [Vibrio salinus]
MEMYPIRTAKEFIALGYNVYCVCLDGGHIQNHMRELGVECFSTTSKAKLLSQQLFRLNNWLKERNVTVVHSHKSGDILISALLHCLMPRKSFFTEHMGVKRPKKDVFHKMVYRHLSKVFSISNETYQRNIKALPIELDKITPLLLGTYVPEIQPVANNSDIIKIKQSVGLPEHSFVVGTVGRVCYGKGQMHLFDAFCLLSEEYPDLHLLIVGGISEADGSDSLFVHELKEKIDKARLVDRVHLTGFRKDTKKMYSIMDIVCLPYHDEAFGLTAIESMAQAKALVVSNTGALPEVVNEAAILCDPLNPKDIANKIRLFIENTSIKSNYSHKAYCRAKNKFSINKHIQKLIGFYS